MSKLKIMQTYRTANGVNFTMQTRSLNWREIEARAESIVSDPTKRDAPKTRARTKRDTRSI
jgi:hypothetical protein